MITIESRSPATHRRSLRHRNGVSPNHTAQTCPHETAMSMRHRNFPNNGVVPQQATYAVGLLLADLAVLLGAGSAEPSGYAEGANAA